MYVKHQKVNFFKTKFQKTVFYFVSQHKIQNILFGKWLKSTKIIDNSTNSFKFSARLYNIRAIFRNTFVRRSTSTWNEDKVWSKNVKMPEKNIGWCVCVGRYFLLSSLRIYTNRKRSRKMHTRKHLHFINASARAVAFDVTLTTDFFVGLYAL